MLYIEQHHQFRLDGSWKVLIYRWGSAERSRALSGRPCSKRHATVLRGGEKRVAVSNRTIISNIYIVTIWLCVWAVSMQNVLKGWARSKSKETGLNYSVPDDPREITAESGTIVALRCLEWRMRLMRRLRKR